MTPQRTIKITANGPYLVSADIPLKHVKIKPLKSSFLGEYNTAPHTHNGFYTLCRCGHSKNAPFCDGEHVKFHFNGTETADHTPYLERAGVYEGRTMQLLDDDRCAFARFCHRQDGSVWDLLQINDRMYRDQIVEGASLCPTGRLTAILENHLVENNYEPQILVVEDPQRGVSAGLFVQGDISIIGADGVEYEHRNRTALCRCGNSENKPFCDAIHVTSGFNA
ncbi:MAG: CDGSH iron-sulfur domain-containing protein [Bacteroidales bacterium]|jgi:CDGSH-type Zn-finger protein|nr:CDGSH iron-sulfur domain-containing protein [Bacteroidales bacterium]